MTAPRALLSGIVCGAILLAVLYLGRSWLESSASDSPILAPPSDVAPSATPALIHDASPDPTPAAREERPEATRAVLADTQASWLQVVEHTGGPPIGGLDLEISFWGLPPSHPYAEHVRDGDSPLRVRTDADGLVSFADLRDSDGFVELRVPGEPLWILQPRTFPSTEPGPTSETALEVTCLTDEIAPFLGRVVDAVTGEAVAGLGVTVEEWGDSERAPGRSRRREDRYPPVAWVITEEDGSFTTPRSWPRGKLALRCNLQEVARVDHVPGSPRQEVPLRVGPLVRLDFDPPPGLETGDFRAFYDREPESHLWSSRVCEPYDLEVIGARAHPFDWWSFSVQGGKTPWVRFQHDARRELLPSRLGVVSANGLWFGHAPLVSFEAHRTEPLRIELEARAAVFGRVTLTEGRRLLGEDLTDVDIGLEPVTTEGARMPYWRYAMSGLEREVTHFRYGGLTPGRWRVLIRNDGYHPHEEIVDLAAGDTAHLDVVLRPRQYEGVVSGTIHSASGANLDGRDGRADLDSVRIYHVDGADHGYAWSSVEWAEGVGSFRADGLPPGRYDLELGWMGGGFSFAPTAARTATAGEPVRITVRDDVPSVTYDIYLEGEVPEGRIDCSLQWQKDGSRSGFGFDRTCERENASRPLWSFGPYERGGTVRGHVLLGDHVPLWFDDTSFEPIDEAGRRRFRSALQPGWGARLAVQDETGTPVAGVLLALDDRALSPTDAEGFVTATAPGKPRLLRVISAEWALADPPSGHHPQGAIVPDSGTFRTYEGELEVFLRRR